jgi:formate C-acetyltransferase
MISKSQGSPFILNFDERSIAGLVREGIPKDKAWNYACVGCLENTMQGNDRSGTINCNLNLAKSIESTLWNGKSISLNDVPKKKIIHNRLKSGVAETFKTWEEFWYAWKKQISFSIKYIIDIYNLAEVIRADYFPTPYLSTLFRGCIEKGIDLQNGGPELCFVTIEGIGFATTVDSLLAIKKLVYDEKKYTISQIKDALIHDFEGENYIIMQTNLKNKAPKYGNDDDSADKLAQDIMKTWTDEVWKYQTPTNFQFRPGMFSGNSWAGAEAKYTIATPNGRNSGKYLSNAICPTVDANIKGPTAIINSVGTVLGGKAESGEYINYLPNGASHTLTFNPGVLRDPEHKMKFKSFLKGCVENGGTCIQINMLDANILKDAQNHPESYKNLLVRVTGFNSYFTAIGKELQDEIIARESHNI